MVKTTWQDIPVHRRKLESVVLKEHHNMRRASTTAVGDHPRDTGHTLDFSSSLIIARENDTFKRRIREASKFTVRPQQWVSTTDTSSRWSTGLASITIILMLYSPWHPVNITFQVVAAKLSYFFSCVVCQVLARFSFFAFGCPHLKIILKQYYSPQVQ